MSFVRVLGGRDALHGGSGICPLPDHRRPKTFPCPLGTPLRGCVFLPLLSYSHLLHSSLLKFL